MTLARATWLTAAAANLVMICHFWAIGVWPFTTTGQLGVYDFAVFWAAGLRVLQGEPTLIFDGAKHIHLIASNLGAPVGNSLQFPYPPPALLFVWPLGFVSYSTAWIGFTAITALVWLMVLHHVTRDWVVASGMCLAIGGATQSIMLGQNGFLTASLATVVAIARARRPVVAGVALGLLCLKPQLALGIILALVLWRDWRVLAWALFSVAMLSTITTAVFGASIWSAFLIGNTSYASLVAAKQHSLIEPMMQSPFSLMLRGLGWTGAALAQIVVILLVAAILTRLHDERQRGAALIAASVLVTPFSYLYDLTMLIGAMALISQGYRKSAPLGALIVIGPALWYYTLAPFGCLAALIVLALAYAQSLASKSSPPAFAET